MALVEDLADFTDAVYNLFDGKLSDLGIRAIFYGDQNRIPTTPALCVEPDDETSVYKGAPRMMLVTFRLYLLVYHSAITSPQENRRNSDTLAKDVKAVANADPTLGGLLIDSYVSNVASGYVVKDRTLMRASRITFEGRSQARLP